MLLTGDFPLGVEELPDSSQFGNLRISSYFRQVILFLRLPPRADCT